MRCIGTVEPGETRGSEPLRGSVPRKVTGQTESWSTVPELFDHLATSYGDREVGVMISPNGRFVGPPETPHPWEMSRVIEYLREHRRQVDGGIWYMQQLAFADLPGVEHLFPLPPAVDSAALQLSSLWLSPGGTTTGLHLDYWHNLLVVLSGQKHLKLFPPKWIDHLYLYPPNTAHPHICRVDLEELDLTRYPLVAETEFYTCSLAAGDALYLPAYWFHHVRSEGVSVAANFWWTPSVADCVGPPLVRVLGANYVYYQFGNLARMVDLAGVSGSLGRWLLERGESIAAVLASGAELIHQLRGMLEATGGGPVDVPVNRERDLLDRAAPLLDVPASELAGHLDLAQRVRMRRVRPSMADAAAAVAAADRLSGARPRVPRVPLR